MDYLAGKTAIVTGVSKGLGLSFCKALLERGVQVAGWGRHAPELQHPNFRFFPCNFLTAEEVEKTWLETQTFLGETVSILINNAGFGYFKPVDEMEPEQWLAQIHINLSAQFFCTRVVVPGMKTKGIGHIVNLSSVAGKTGASWGSAYSASKFGVAGFSESLMQELREYGIKVSVIYPGSTATHFFDEVPGISVHENMLRAEDITHSLMHLLDTHPNNLISELVIRPLISKPPKTNK
jgi:short-subunit dehydrogenase